MLIFDDLLKNHDMASVAYSYMTLDAVEHGGVTGRRHSEYPQQRRARSQPAGSDARTGSISKQTSRKRERKKGSSNKVDIGTLTKLFYARWENKINTDTNLCLKL